MSVCGPAEDVRVADTHGLGGEQGLAEELLRVVGLLKWVLGGLVGF